MVVMQIAKHWRERESRLRMSLLQYVKKTDQDGKTTKRSLRYRNWEVCLGGSVKSFGKDVIKKILATAGLKDNPRETSSLVFSLLMKEGDGMVDSCDVLAEAMISGAGSLSVEVREGLLLAATDLAKREVLGAAHLAKVAMGVGLKKKEALEYVQISMNGASKQAIKDIYVGMGERS